jgi:hypothetical protein
MPQVYSLPYANLRSARRPVVEKSVSGFPAWLALIGLIIPAAEVQIYFGSAKFTVGRLGVVLLLLPACVALCRSGRRLIISDVFAVATAAWIVAAGITVGGSTTLPSAVAESLEFFGGYIVARAFFFGPAALEKFISVLKILTCIAVAFAIAESVSGRLIIHELVASVMHTLPPDAQFRNGMVRAMSTFDHAILFGAFCSLTGTILLFTEPTLRKKIFYVGICLLGCILSWSSSAFLTLFIVFTAYNYDRIMRRFSRRWTVFWSMLAIVFLLFFAVSNNPMSWIISHLTLDPVSGYFRLMIWDAAFQKFEQSLWVGFGFNPLGNWILDATVDSVWLVFALRFGVPMVILLFLTGITAMLPAHQAKRVRGQNPYMDSLSTAFTTVLIMFMFIGLTVHMWNYMWIFWSLCLGIRASIREWYLSQSTSISMESQGNLQAV